MDRAPSFPTRLRTESGATNLLQYSAPPPIGIASQGFPVPVCPVYHGSDRYGFFVVFQYIAAGSSCGLGIDRIERPYTLYSSSGAVVATFRGVERHSKDAAGLPSPFGPETSDRNPATADLTVHRTSSSCVLHRQPAQGTKHYAGTCTSVFPVG
jgi:hypothetical protein